MPKKTALEKLAEATVAAFERRETRPNVAFDMTRAELVDESNRKLDWNVISAVKEAPLSLTITGASTVKLVCEDPEFELLNDPLFAGWMFEKKLVSKSSAKTYSGRKITNSNKTARYGEESEEEWILPSRPIDLNLDGVWFRLAGFQVQETTLTLTFEDRVAAILRKAPGFSTVNRGDFTRAQFVKKQVKEAEREHGNHGKVPLFIPEAKIVQPISALEPAETATDLKSSATRSLTTSDGITVKGQPATDAQLKVLNTALEVAVEAKAPFKAQVALYEALVVENTASNPDPGNENDMGCLSMTAATAASMPSVNPFNIIDPCTVFLVQGFSGNGGAIALAKNNPHLTTGEIAQAVQGSGAGAASGGNATYGLYSSEAEHAVRVFGGTAATEGLTGATVPGAYAFTRGPSETYWDCIQRLASEVGWYAFVRDNTLWFVSGTFLLAQRAQLHVQRGKHGIDWVNPNIDIGARDNIAEVEVIGRAALWTAVSGNAVQVARVGPANGKWVVDTITLDVMDRSDAINVKLQKPLPPRPEPAATGATVGVGELEGGAARGASKGSALAAFYAASALSELQLPYVWGGGHAAGSLAKVKKGGEGLDCSGSTCWILHEAGMFPSTTGVVSGDLESWGTAGEGKEMTVWANANHVFIVFRIPGHAEAQANTNGPQNGPRLYSVGSHPTYNVDPPHEGYVARHWQGT